MPSNRPAPRRARGGQAVLGGPGRPQRREKARVVIVVERDGFVRAFGRPDETAVAVVHAVWAHYPSNEQYARQLTDLRCPPWVRGFLADPDVRELGSGSARECFDAGELADIHWQLDLIKALKELGASHAR